MKKFVLFLLVCPLFCFAGKSVRSFPKNASGFATGDSYYYGNFQTSFSRVLGGVGVRFQDDELGFDANFGGSVATQSKPNLLQTQLSVLFYPMEEYFYGGAGGGITLHFEKQYRLESFLSLSLGVDYHTEKSGKYFAEAAIQTPANFDLNKIPLAPGFRIGVGY